MPAIYRVETHWSGLQGGPGLTVCHFTGGGGTPAQASTDMAAFWQATNDRRGTGVTWTMNNEVLIVESDDGEILDAVAVTAATGVGNAGGDDMPDQINGLLRLTTGVYFNGRRLQGRIFLPGATESQSGPGGIPSGEYTADYDAAAATLLGSANSGLIVWRRPQPENSLIGEFAVVSGATTKGTWATLRKRGAA